MKKGMGLGPVAAAVAAVAAAAAADVDVDADVDTEVKPCQVCDSFKDTNLTILCKGYVTLQSCSRFPTHESLCIFMLCISTVLYVSFLFDYITLSTLSHFPFSSCLFSMFPSPHPSLPPPHPLVLCRCDTPYHTYCVGLGRTVPDYDWYCTPCTNKGRGQQSQHPQTKRDASAMVDTSANDEPSSSSSSAPSSSSSSDLYNTTTSTKQGVRPVRAKRGAAKKETGRETVAAAAAAAADHDADVDTTDTEDKPCQVCHTDESKAITLLCDGYVTLQSCSRFFFTHKLVTVHFHVIQYIVCFPSCLTT